MNMEVIFKYIRDIESGKSIDELAKENNIWPERLRAYLLEYGGTKGKNILLKEITEQLPITVDELKNEFENYRTITEIASKIGVPVEFLKVLIYKYESISGKKMPRKRIGLNKRNDLDTDKIINDYRRGVSIPKIAQKYNASTTAIINRINEYIDKTSEDIHTFHKKNLKILRKEKKHDNKKDEESIKENNKKRQKEKEQIKFIKELIEKHNLYKYADFMNFIQTNGIDINKNIKYIYFVSIKEIEKDIENNNEDGRDD